MTLDPTRTLPSKRQERHELERFVLGVSETLPDLDRLRDAGLSGYAYTALPGHPERTALRADFAAAAARHLAVRGAIADLLRSFVAAGIEVLVFKGFYLAEFVFDAPGRRLYADVDIAVRPEDVDVACQVVDEPDWILVWRAGEPDDPESLRGPEYTGHEAAQFKHRRLDVTVDLHRRLVHNLHNRVPAGPVPERLTRAAWDGAPSATVDGSVVRVLRPEDALVFGLAVNRCWGSDRWRIKPRDFLDAAALVERFELRPDTVEARAAELGVSRTWRIYSDRCDPFRRRVDLAPPSWWARLRWNLAVAPERGGIGLRGLPLAVSDMVVGAADVLRALPYVLAARRGRDVGSVRTAPNVRGVAARTLTSNEWRRLRRGVHRALRIVGPGLQDRDHVRALAVARMLRRRGFAALPDPWPPDVGNVPSVLVNGRRLRARPW